MSVETTETPGTIWDKLSEDSRKLCAYLVISPVKPEGLKVMAEDVGNVATAVEQLRTTNVLEEVTFVQELEETMERLKPGRDLLALDASPLTADEKKYLHTRGNLEIYRDSPEKFRSWSEPKYRLRADFKQFVAEKFRE